MVKPAVSICCTTYNHARYIRDAIEGFLMQRTNFPFEILIYDDASTDGTADIIREYVAKYPDIIKPTLQKENQYSKGKSIWCEYQFPYARGKYIALCEGDDFWTDSNKLQIQYDFMEKHSDYSICMHNRNILNTIRKYYLKSSPVRHLSCSAQEMRKQILQGDLLPYTQTLFFRVSRYIEIRKEFCRDVCGAPMADVQLLFHLVSVGKLFFHDYYMATYRIAPGSAMNWKKNGEIGDSFLVGYEKALGKLADNNNCGEYVRRASCVPASGNHHSRINLPKLIIRTFLWNLKKCYGRYMFWIYKTSSSQKRCKLRPL